MKKPAVFNSIQKKYHARYKFRREVIENSNKALNLSKRAIFSFHRDEMEEGEIKLKEAVTFFEKCEKHISKFPDLKDGAYRAALEEYAEALLFESYLKTRKIGKIDQRAMDEMCYLAGLCDTTGEIVRYAVRNATKGKNEEVQKAFETVETVVEFLMDLDLTGYLRTKFDQAKNNLRRLEQVMYDLSQRQ